MFNHELRNAGQGSISYTPELSPPTGIASRTRSRRELSQDSSAVCEVDDDLPPLVAPRLEDDDSDDEDDDDLPPPLRARPPEAQVSDDNELPDLIDPSDKGEDGRNASAAAIIGD